MSQYISGSMQSSGQVVGLLPAPRILLSNNKLRNSLVGTFPLTVGNPNTSVLVGKDVFVTAMNIPVEILENSSTLLPLLELVRFRRRSGGKVYDGSSKTSRYSAFVHPSNGPAPSGMGNDTHGGLQGGVSPIISAIRVTEWPLVSRNQKIDVTNGIMSFMCFRPVSYRDSTNTIQSVNGVSGMTARGSDKFGKRFSYAPEYTPGYFKFRWSVVDPNDARGGRIYGPLSETISVTNKSFPFVPEAPFLDTGVYKQTSSVRLDYVPTEMSLWLGNVSRLPR